MACTFGGKTFQNTPEEPAQSLTYAYLLGKYGLIISWQEAAAELGVYWEQIRRMCAKGDIDTQKIGRSWLLTTRALADYIDHGPAVHQRAPADPPKQPRRERLLSL